MSKPSKIFIGYRALGFVSNHVPLSMRYIQRRKENLVVTAVGKSFHTYGCSKFLLLSVSNPHPDEINYITSDSYLVFTACKNVIYAWRRGTELKHIYQGHEKDVHLLMPFGPHLLSVDENSILKVWDIKTEDIVLELSFSNSSFCITSLLHPSTYLNKILLGSKQGSLQLWNLKTNKLVYTFSGWESSVTVLQQAPAIDVIAVGLASGSIIIHNLKFNETIMKFYQDWGPVTTISFRTDGSPVMATGSTVGHIVLWDLEKKRLHSEIRNAHKGSVTGMKFLPNEPLLVTSSPDNTLKFLKNIHAGRAINSSSIGSPVIILALDVNDVLHLILKMWIFDMPDDGGRLLRLREGHNDPPLKIRFHGSNGKNILSAGLDSTLRSFSTAADNLNKNLGQASYNRKIAKKKGIKNDPGKMPPIVDFTSETTREKEWDNISACHRGLGLVTTWSYDNCRMGTHKLLHDRFKGAKNITALCVTLSSCGNFVLIGYNTGHVDKFNIQSGLFRGTYGGEKAHNGSVRGIVTDGLNQLTTTGGSDMLLKFWKFREGTLLSSLKLQDAVSHMIIHRESSMIAIALDSFAVIIVDQETRRIVRTFDGHGGRISDMTFSPDSRWLLTSSMDSAIRTWDLPTGRLLDCFMVSPVCTSLSISPTGDYLATTHAGDIGIYLWSNATLYSHVSLYPLPSDYEPQFLELPVVSLEGNSTDQNENEQEDINETEEEGIPEFKSPEQISDELVTLSLLPHSHWRNLLNLDVIQKRNKPKEPFKIPKNAPFFLPVIEGLKPSFAIEASSDNKKDDATRIRMSFQPQSPFAELLHHCGETRNYTTVLEKLNDMSPPVIDDEIRKLLPPMEISSSSDDSLLLLYFMQAMDQGLRSNKDFELIQSYLGLFLKIHGETIASKEQLYKFASELKESQLKAWQRLQMKFNQSLCLVNYMKSAVFSGL